MLPSIYLHYGEMEKEGIRETEHRIQEQNVTIARLKSYLAFELTFQFIYTWSDGEGIR